jgi:NADPH:quinone reductase-like Zn-dependent oxidoreductase
MRLQFGVRKPKNPILGLDLAGEIEAVGADGSRFQVGDQVFGTTEPLYGAHAEYICLPEDAVLAPKPVNMSHDEAATIPGMANTALHFIRDVGDVRAGDQILINGASGGIGTFAVQLAKHYGATVTGVCSAKNLELVRSLGADYVIDYTREDFTKTSQTYDVIFDVVAKSSFSRCRGALKANGRYLVTIPKLEVLLQMAWTSLAGGKKVRMEGAPARVDNLLVLKELIEAGNLRSVIGRRYPLEETAEAFRYVETGHKVGNVVITVANGGG